MVQPDFFDLPARANSLWDPGRFAVNTELYPITEL